MALTDTTYEDNSDGLVLGGDTTTASRSYTAGQLVCVLWATNNSYPGDGTVSCTNSGAAQTWNDIEEVYVGESCYIRGWWCVMSTSQSMTISCASTANNNLDGVIYTLVHDGQHATTPIPAGKVYSGVDADGDTNQSITPTASGSCLWMIAADYQPTNSFVAAADCTLHDQYHIDGQYTVALIRPTTQPRTDASAFTIGETDTGAKNSWIAFEVVAAEVALGEYDPIPIPQPLPGALGVYRSIRGRIG